VFDRLLVPARDKGAWGGRGSGKSHFFATLLVEDCIRAPGESGGEGLRAVCLREVQRDLAQSSKALIEAKIRQCRVGERDGFKVYKEVIETPGDGLILFKGMQTYSAESIKSLEDFRRAWWEEAQTATAHSIALLRPTLRAPGSQMWWSWNPRRKSDPVDMMLRGAQIPTGAVVVRANWRDNPWLTPELTQERNDCLRIHPERYDHIWEGDYISAAEGAYYARSLAEARSEGRIGRVAFDPLMTVRLFCDIGGTGARADAFAIWPAQFVGREIRTRDYYEAVGQPLSAHLAWARAQGYGPERAEFWLPHDGATRDRVYAVSYESALREAGYRVNVVPNQGKGAAAARIEALRRIFPQIWFDEPTTAAGRDALGWYHEKKDDARGIGLGPDHDWSSHAADAAGLMAIAYEAPKRAQKIVYSNKGIV
jgi:phage terminase large subunit